MNQPHFFQTHRFYRIDGRILYCKSYTWQANNPDNFDIFMEGIAPEHYAAYKAHCLIGENQMPYRTLAEMNNIPFPEIVELHLSSETTIEMINEEEALNF